MTVYSFMFRKFTVVFLALSLCWTTVACGRPDETIPTGRDVNTTANAPAPAAPTQMSDGQYPVQQATYNDADGEYSLMLLNTPSGTPPTFRTTNLQMARLTDEEIKAGQKSYLKVENGQSALYLAEDFRIEYIHNVTETTTNPQTGQPQTTVVRQEGGNFWAPFAGAAAGSIAGQVIGNALFRPQYYVPPAYQPGGLRGFGGYGSTFNQAADRYQTRYNAPPLAVRNRAANLRTTGRVRTPSTFNQPAVRTAPRTNTGNRATGSGFGSSTLRPSERPNSTIRRPSSGSFGSSGSRSRSSGRRR